MLKRILFLFAAVFLLVAVVVFSFRTSEIGFEKTKIDSTPYRIAQIKNINQWEFLTVECQVLVDTLRQRQWPISPDCLARIYSGTLRLGVDLGECSDDWIEIVGDSVVNLHLPCLSLLDNRFIDEAATLSFYESGSWSESAKEEMYGKAAVKMRELALTDDNINMARAQAVSRFTSLFRALGFDKVNVRFADSCQ